MIIAITGYIGCGKSTVAGIFREHGFRVVNADSIGHEMLRDRNVKDKLVAIFGMDILGRDLEIDRDKLGRMVFDDEFKLRRLDSIIHPLIKKELDNAVKKGKDDTVIDAALFTELGIGEMCDKTVLVKSDLENMYTRLQSKYSKSDVLSIMNTQDIIHDADFVIENNGTLEDLKRIVEEIIGRIR